MPLIRFILIRHCQAVFKVGGSIEYPLLRTNQIKLNTLVVKRAYVQNVKNLRKSIDNYYLSNHYQQLQIFQNVRFKSTTTKEEIMKVTDQKEIHNPVEKIIVGPELTAGQKLKKAVAEYGSTVIVFHIGISLMSLGTCYVLVSAGIDANKVFEAVGLGDWLSKTQVAANAGKFAVAYAIHKVFAPVRIGVTLTSVPFIVRYLRKVGILKK